MRFKGFVLAIWCILALPKALQVLCHLLRQRQVFCVKSFDLIDRGSSVFGKVEDVHFAKAVDDPHTNRRMTQGIQRMSLARERIDLKPSPIQQRTKLPLYYLPSRGAVGILRQEQWGL